MESGDRRAQKLADPVSFFTYKRKYLKLASVYRRGNVLEIGSGCGAVTGALCKKAKKVTCIELSRKRSLINANRHKDFDNLKILMGNFQDIEKNLTEKYDYITLIGVFEYGEAYIQSVHRMWIF